MRRLSLIFAGLLFASAAYGQTLPSPVFVKLSLVGTASETGSVGLNHNLVNTTDNAILTGAGSFLNHFTIQSTMSSPLNQGGRQNFFSLLMQTSPTASSNANRNYVGAAFAVDTSSGDGGTGLTTGTAKGAYFAMNPVAILRGAATNVYDLSGGEINIAAQTGSSTLYKSGLRIASLSSDAVRGTASDAMLSLTNQSGAVGWGTGIAFSPESGQFPLVAGGTVVGAYNGAAQYGVDFSLMTFSGSAFRSTGFSVDGSGNAVLANVAPTGTVTLNNGNGYRWNGTAGAYAGGSSGANIFQFSDGTMYLDNYQGGFTFRGAAFAALGGLTSTGFNLPNGSSYQINGAPVLGTNGLTLSPSLSGTASLANWSSINIATDTVSPCAFCTDFNITHHFQPTTRGARSAGFDWLIQDNASTTGVGPTVVVGRTMIGQSNAGDGGTNLTNAGAKGTYFGANTMGRNAGTNVQEVVGIESDLMTTSASSARYAFGYTAANYAAVQGSALDAAFGVYSGGSIDAGGGSGPWGPGVGFHCGICFAELSANGLVPLDSGATVLGTHLESLGTIPVAKGIDLSGFTISGEAFKSNLFAVTGAGVVFAQQYWANGAQGVSCAAGTVNLSTMVVTNGIVTHC